MAYPRNKRRPLQPGMVPVVNDLEDQVRAAMRARRVQTVVEAMKIAQIHHASTWFGQVCRRIIDAGHASIDKHDAAKLSCFVGHDIVDNKKLREIERVRRQAEKIARERGPAKFHGVIPFIETLLDHQSATPGFSVQLIVPKPVGRIVILQFIPGRSRDSHRSALNTGKCWAAILGIAHEDMTADAVITKHTKKKLSKLHFVL